MKEVGKRMDITEEQEVSTAKRLWRDYGDIVVTLAVVFVIFKIILQLAWVPTGSMETTLPTKSLLIGWHLPYAVSDPMPKRGDVVTFWDEEEDSVLVKRVIGLPGDQISFAEGYTYRNGEKIEEAYLPFPGNTYSEKTFEVPEDCFFFMGDNRGNSKDSRFLDVSYVPIDAIQAKVMICISLGSSHAWQGVHIIANH